MMTITSWTGRDHWCSTTNGAVMVNNPIILIPVETDHSIDDERVESHQDALDRAEAEKLTPSSSVLREIARRSAPPQEWWDEDFEGL
jgi:hypothetical protein